MKIKLISIIFMSLSIAQFKSAELNRTLERGIDFNEKFSICVNKDIDSISVENILNDLRLTNYKNNFMDFSLYINNNGVREKIINDRPIILKGSNTYCSNDKVQYNFELKIDSNEIIKNPESSFYNSLSINKIEKSEIISTEEVDIIYKTQAVGIQVKNLKDFDLTFNNSSEENINIEKDFCVYTNGAGKFSFTLTDKTANNNWQLVNNNDNITKIPYQMKIKTTSTEYVDVFNGVILNDFNGNTNDNCSSGDLFYLNIFIKNEDLINKYGGYYFPDNIDNSVYITVTLEGNPI